MANFTAIIIGCGKIAGLHDDKDNTHVYSHAHAYQVVENIDLICCCDLDLNLAKSLAKKYNIDKVSKDYLGVIEEVHPDVVSICTPDVTHFTITKAILESDKVPKIIFLEKPACQNEYELNYLIELSKEKAASIVVNHSRRFDSLHQELKLSIENNEFGKLIKADVVYYSGWQHNGVHMIDTLNFLFSDKLTLLKFLGGYESPYKDDLSLDFQCKFEENKALVYITTMNEEFYQLFECDFKFENVRIRLEDFGLRATYEKKVINSMNENVLVKIEDYFTLKETSPMQAAVEIIVANLSKNSSLKGYLIEDISQTMKTIWKGLEWVK